MSIEMSRYLSHIKSKEEPNVLIVGYSTTWCGPCKLMDPKAAESFSRFASSELR